jgi:hypothetical protein
VIPFAPFWQKEAGATARRSPRGGRATAQLLKDGELWCVPSRCDSVTGLFLNGNTLMTGKPYIVANH